MVLNNVSWSVATLVIALFLAASASAVDLQNKDDVEYRVTVTEQGKSKKFRIPPLGVKLDACTSRCRIAVHEIGAIEPGDSEVVYIWGGQLEKEDKK